MGNARLFVLVVFISLTAMTTFIHELYGENISLIQINIEYLPEEDTGIVSMDVRFAGRVNNTLVTIPLLPDADIQVISVEDSEGNQLLYSVGKNNVLNIYVNDTDEITIRYTVSGLSEEIGVGVYVLSIDLTPYSNVSDMKSELILLEKYNVTIPSGEARVEYTANTTRIILEKPQNYFIIVTVSAVTPPVTGGGGGAKTTAQTPKPPIQPVPPTNYILWVIVGIVVAVVGYLAYRYRRAEMIVVTIPPGKLLEDETVKEIILAVGDAGPEGIKQSELVRLTGKPKSTISRRVRRLAEEGYLEVVRSGKYNIIRLTSKGYESYKELRKGMKKR